ncbi:MAG: YSC84-related protein, partial [Planctomycetota bacterium]
DVKATVAQFEREHKAVRVYLEDAYAYAVFPAVGKGGMGVGGAFGRGQVYRNGRRIGYAKLTSASIGLQLGGQSFSEIIFFEDKASFERFRNGELAFDANASAVAAETGVAARVDYENGVAVFVISEAGLMFEASIGGQMFDYVSG